MIDIAEFRAIVNSYGGLANPSRFAVYITPPSFLSGSAPSYDTFNPTDYIIGLNEGVNMADVNAMSFLCDSAMLPGKSLQMLEYRPQGYGKISKIPYDIAHGPMSLRFMLDNDHRVLNFLEYWMQEIINTSGEFEGSQSTFKNRTSYELNYKKNYSTTIAIQFFAEGDPDNFIEYTFMDVYPMQLGSLQLAWDQTDQIAKLDVEFSYSSYSVFRGSLGSIGTYSFRGVDYYQTSSYFNNLLSSLTDNSYGGVRNLIENFTRL
jgi:hypothetical protein